jgi:catechol 2,3-dioxygenase-like lactoylglutathione lyase family enzyme
VLGFTAAVVRRQAAGPAVGAAAGPTLGESVGVVFEPGADAGRPAFGDTAECPPPRGVVATGRVPAPHGGTSVGRARPPAPSVGDQHTHPVAGRMAGSPERHPVRPADADDRSSPTRAGTASGNPTPGSTASGNPTLGGTASGNPTPGGTASASGAAVGMEKQGPRPHGRPAPGAPQQGPARAGQTVRREPATTARTPSGDRVRGLAYTLGIQLQPLVHVADMAASVAFYEQLGAEIVHGAPDADWVLLQLGTTQIGLVGWPPEAEQGECAVELNFAATVALDELESRLHEAGAAVAGVIAHRDFGAQLHVRTPDGLLIKIAQLEPDVAT